MAARYAVVADTGSPMPVAQTAAAAPASNDGSPGEIRLMDSVLGSSVGSAPGRAATTTPATASSTTTAAAMLSRARRSGRVRRLRTSCIGADRPSTGPAGSRRRMRSSHAGGLSSTPAARRCSIVRTPSSRSFLSLSWSKVIAGSPGGGA